MFVKQETNVACGNLAHIRDVTVRLQQRALLENGIKEEDLNAALAALHNVRVSHPHLLDLTVYGKYDVSRRVLFVFGVLCVSITQSKG
jgi:hypothetical protein